VAINAYGASPLSPGGNGAVMIVVPDAPLSLTNNFAVTNK